MPYSAGVRRTGTWVIAALAAGAAAAPARAGGLVIGAGSPRAIGRAGTGTVGDDGAGALLVNPAALARRDGLRAQLGVGFADDELTWRRARDTPLARDQASSHALPTGAVIGAVGGWVIGVGAMTAAVSERALRRPAGTALGDQFDYRYAGLGGAIRRDTVTAGVARRIGDSVAVGASFGASRVAVAETRRLWAGFRDVAAVGSPTHDVEIALSGADLFVPGAVAGVLIAPGDHPIELGASFAWSGKVVVRDEPLAITGTPDGPSVAAGGARADLTLRPPLTARAGVRYLGRRVVVELGGDLWIAPAAAAEAAWRLDGVRVIDRSTVETPLARVPSRISLRTHGAIRAAVDAELIGGFLWATGGYAYTVGGTSAARLSPTFGDLGGHTAALGLEGQAGGFTLTLGWSRTWSAARTPTSTALSLDNPFGAGDAPVPLGTFDGSIDQLGALLDLAFDAL